LSAAEEPSVIERVLTAIVHGEADRVIELLHPAVEWSPTVWSGAEMYRGHEGVRRWLAQFGEGLEHLDIRVQKMELQGDRGAIIGIVFDTRGNQKFAVEVPWSYELEDGLVRRGRAHGTWEEAAQAAGLA
jgi:ketosteroid isomerase-like protein